MQLRRLGLFFILLLVPVFVSAESDNDLEVVAETVKYYKTTTVLSNSEIMRAANLGEVSSLTTEITEEEYNSVDTSTNNTNNPRSMVSYEVETTYKRLATTMSKNGNLYYRYKTTLEWKLIPSTRSYDIIAIGHLATVKLNGLIDFTQYYCRSSSDCYEVTSYWADSFVNGAAAMFKVPTGTLTSLNQVLEFDVEKDNSSATITEQIAAGDYAHATSSISYTNAQKFNVDVGGINLNSSIEDYYDSITEAEAIWDGTW